MTLLEMAKILRALYEKISFTCKLCSRKHPSPGIDMYNLVPLFPRETMECVRDDKQQYYIRCRECSKSKSYPGPQVTEKTFGASQN